MEQEKIIVKGARQHNLKNIDVEIPRNTLTVITGLSGSGKSSLAFDTIYAEGQRRYIESLSAYARQFLDQLEKPDVDLIEGLSPAISIEQKATSGNPRSTVGTVTEIYDYLRLLYARLGAMRCPTCGSLVRQQSVAQINDSILREFDGKTIMILTQLIKGRKGHYRELFEDLARAGFTKARVDGEIVEIEKGMSLARYKVHTIEQVIDRITINEKNRQRLETSVDLALRTGQGMCIVHFEGKDTTYSKHRFCFNCNISYPELAPNSFSFNSPFGACEGCGGLGEKKEFEEDLIIPDAALSIQEEGIAPLGKPRDIWVFTQLESLAEKMGFDFTTPIKKLSKEQRHAIIYGHPEPLPVYFNGSKGKKIAYHQKFTGVLGYLENAYYSLNSQKTREWVEGFMTSQPCKQCNGGRLKKEFLSVYFQEKNIQEVTSLPINHAYKFFSSAELYGKDAIIAAPILKEITSRLEFLQNVGLDYLTLNRSAGTLSGGESQRIRLATQIGTQLAGALYVLDEPSIGLHQSDNVKLIQSLKQLRDLNNTVIVVEHDRETIESSDYLVDLGPGAGEHGGKVIYAGDTAELMNSSEDTPSSTLAYLRDIKKIEVPAERRKGNGKELVLTGASGNNLKNVTLRIPLGVFVAITGVSGSGKSTLINETLVKLLSAKLNNAVASPLPYKTVTGVKNLDKVIEIDQSPIGRTPRSNPATYTGLFTYIREIFFSLPEAKMRGYAIGRFSFNVKGGRCEACEGDGLKRIEMNFLPDVYVTCDVCHGKRYNRETLEVLFKTKNISDVLDMTVEEALGFFEDIPRVYRKIKALADVGLGYIKLGQQATTLSGGEAQRVKLATELSKVSTGNTIYFLDEPTTGLHFEDVSMLLNVLNRLVDKGNTVVIVEHNLDVIKVADHIVDLGPGGGEAGGKIVAQGTPEEVALSAGSRTAPFLIQELAKGKRTQ